MMIKRIWKLFSRVVPSQLNNPALSEIIRKIVEHTSKGNYVIIEIGAGQGRGSTLAIFKAIESITSNFRMFSYEPNKKMYQKAVAFWKNEKKINFINEFLMKKSDIDLLILPQISEPDYISTYNLYGLEENYFSGADYLDGRKIDLVFIDSVRYSHAAIIKNLVPFLSADTWIVMEDDIPQLGEKKILEKHFQLINLAIHQLENHQWPILTFQIKNL